MPRPQSWITVKLINIDVNWKYREFATEGQGQRFNDADLLFCVEDYLTSTENTQRYF